MHHSALKSFVQSFGLALRQELNDTGMTITLLMPGPTETEFFERADMLDTRVGASDKDDPADAARDGFEALMAGKERVESAPLSTKLQGQRQPPAPRQGQGQDASAHGRAEVGRPLNRPSGR
jgi:uncharacterized protein